MRASTATPGFCHSKSLIVDTLSVVIPAVAGIHLDFAPTSENG
jgi:hypothetical protein